MLYRLYFWLLGTSDDQPRGNWQCEDYVSETARRHRFKLIRPALYKYAMMEGTQDELPVHEFVYECTPPADTPSVQLTAHWTSRTKPKARR